MNKEHFKQGFFISNRGLMWDVVNGDNSARVKLGLLVECNVATGKIDRSIESIYLDWGRKIYRSRDKFYACIREMRGTFLEPGKGLQILNYEEYRKLSNFKFITGNNSEGYGQSSEYQRVRHTPGYKEEKRGTYNPLKISDLDVPRGTFFNNKKERKKERARQSSNLADKKPDKEEEAGTSCKNDTMASKQTTRKKLRELWTAEYQRYDITREDWVTAMVKAGANYWPGHDDALRRWCYGQSIAHGFITGDEDAPKRANKAPSEPVERRKPKNQARSWERNFKGSESLKWILIKNLRELPREYSDRLSEILDNGAPLAPPALMLYLCKYGQEVTVHGKRALSPKEPIYVPRANNPHEMRYSDHFRDFVANFYRDDWPEMAAIGSSEIWYIEK